tara:strand:+ start:3341 stop:4435 length:1095 start_codon:yes stop_codon:yes gene_type:complete
MIVEDNRKIRRVDPSDCKIGDLYKPWYFFSNAAVGCPTDINQVCLIYKIKKKSLTPEKIVSTSFLKVPSREDRGEYLVEALTNSIKEVGQKEDIVCTSHYTLDSPVSIEFLEDPKLKQLRCFEGHHRKVSCESLGIPVNAVVYYLYHMATPINWSNHYSSIYDDSFWAPFQTSETKKPWFTKSSLLDGREVQKYKFLKSCFDFIKSLNIECNTGVDIGCAEGAHTTLASRELSCKMLGIDSEAGRIIRGLLVKAEHNISRVNFMVSDWEDMSYDAFDFGMALSILHHMSIGEDKEFLHKLCVNKKAVIVEVRVRPSFTLINQGSMKGINTKDYYEKMFEDIGINYKLISSCNFDGLRLFYVLFK